MGPVCVRAAARYINRTHDRRATPSSSSIPASAVCRCWRRSARSCLTRPILYVADSAGFPYGTRSSAEIAARVPALLGRLAERFDPALIVIACNTASTIALDAARAALDLPIVGTVPAIKPAAAVSKTRAIGVLGTEATIVQPYVDRLASEFAADCTIVRHGSAELVELAEAKLRGEPTDPAAYARALNGLLDRPGGDKVDTLVLACTHFPLVEDELAAAAPRPLPVRPRRRRHRAAGPASARRSRVAGGWRGGPRPLHRRRAGEPRACRAPGGFWPHPDRFDLIGTARGD